MPGEGSKESTVKIKALKGFKDVIPGEVELWQYLEKVARDVFGRYQFSEIRLPVLEETALFARSIGEGTDIVEKEMYTFVDKQITMRPEATASLLRAYIEHGLGVQKPVQRLFTIGPMFRHERPQKGRLRQFHQLDAEIIGSASPRVDAELIAMAALLLAELQLSVSLELNSLGCPACRPAYRALLLEFIAARLDGLCDDCRRRSATNPLRVLDCKVPGCRERIVDAPAMAMHLCGDCADHFSGVQQALDLLGITYRLNKFMVRGLDYYCRTTFEFITTDLGAQAAVAAGGRYDGLVGLLGGPEQCPGIGFAMGMERLVLLLQQQPAPALPAAADLAIAAVGEEAVLLAFPLAQELRAAGFRVAMDHEGRSLKAQMKQADKSGAARALIIGATEVAAGYGLLRDLRGEGQQEVALNSAALADALL